MNHHTSTKVITQDRKDLDKFLKFLALKTVQVIVQSRLGEKIKTKSRANSATIDWFNIAIEDVLEVQNEAKKALNGQIPSVDFSLCIEISLKTVEGDTLVLETWNLCMNEQCDLSVSSTSVYNRMSLLLKSLIAVTRVTPAYKLSCRQGADSYVICYRAYQGTPRFHQLGEGYQENKIGEALTPLGTLTMSVAYRTKMTITPQKTEKESPFMLKSDYFKPDMSPKRSRPIGMNGFHVEMNPVEEATPVSEGLMNGISSSPVVNGHHCIHPCLLNHVADGDRALWSSDKNGEARNNSINSQMSNGEPKKAGAFAPSTKVPDPSSFPDLLLPDTPFLNLLRSNSNNNPAEMRPPKQESIRNADKNANLNVVVVDNKKISDNAGEVDYNCNANEGGCQKSACSDGSDCGDFVMVELRPPFADSDSNTDLGAFFRECQCAPPLVSFSSQPTLEEQVTDISCQLAMFETSMHDFDNFVDSICHVDAQQ